LIGAARPARIASAGQRRKRRRWPPARRRVNYSLDQTRASACRHCPRLPIPHHRRWRRQCAAPGPPGAGARAARGSDELERYLTAMLVGFRTAVVPARPNTLAIPRCRPVTCRRCARCG
jgi:hypothetical protein